MPSPDNLPRKTGKKSAIRRSEWNAVAEGLRRKSFDETKLPGLPDIIGVNLAEEEIEQWSIFGVTIDDSTDNSFNPLTVNIALLGAETDQGAYSLMFTSEGSKIPGDGGKAVITPITCFKPVRLKVSPDGAAPTAGQECGPLHDSFFVDKGGVGLICLAVEEDEDFIWAARTQVGTFIGKADADIDAMADNTPGYGDVTLWRFKDDGDIEATDVVVKACNLSEATVTAGKVLQMKMIQRRICIDFESCSA